MNLSKEFDTLNDELLIAKLSADGFNNKSLKLMQFHLTNRWQRIKINKLFIVNKPSYYSQKPVLFPPFSLIFIKIIYFFQSIIQKYVILLMTLHFLPVIKT